MSYNVVMCKSNYVSFISIAKTEEKNASGASSFYYFWLLSNWFGLVWFGQNMLINLFSSFRNYKLWGLHLYKLDFM